MWWRLVVGLLDGAAAVGLVDGRGHGVGDPVGVHDDLAAGRCGRPGRRSGSGSGSERRKPSLSASRMADQRHLRQVQALAQQVDADQDVELAQAQVAEDLHPLEGVDVGVEVADLDAQVPVVFGQVLGHALGQGGDQDPLAPAPARCADLLQQVVHLVGGGLDLDLGVHQAGGPDDLLDHGARGTARSS